jgi:glycosyltransferase 2 family protein
VNTRRRALLRVAVAVFVVLAIAFFAFALVDAWNETDGVLPEAWRLLASGGLAAFALLCGAYGWATLLGGDHRIEHGAALVVAQIGKYIPGAVWQATGQLGLAKQTGVPLKRSAVAFTVQAALQVLAGCPWGIVLALTWTDGAPVLRVLVAIGSLALLLLLDRRWMVWALHKIPRTRDASSEVVPAQRSIILAWVACLLSISALSLGYLLMLGSFGTVDAPGLVLSAAAVAWVVGFVAIFAPSGLGVREAVLVGLLRGDFASSVIVAASVYFRLTQVAADGLLALVASHRVRPSRLRAAAAEVSAASEPIEAARPEDG